jgi:hypothetical protein
MADQDQALDRSKLTFAQAEGTEPLPRQLALREVSQELRSYLWYIFHAQLRNVTRADSMGTALPWLSEPWNIMLENWWVLGQHKFIDDFTTKVEPWSSQLSELFKSGSYIQIFDFVQFIIRQRHCPQRFEDQLNNALEKARAAYRIEYHTVIPVVTPEEGEAISRAFADLASAEYGGSRAHLRKAGELLTSGLWADSVRESVHAVESIVVSSSGTAKTLQDALNVIEKRAHINSNLKRAMKALYEYSSDERGVRHSMVFADADVDEADALYMFGACASFLTYLIRKYRVAMIAQAA